MRELKMTDMEKLYLATIEGLREALRERERRIAELEDRVVELTAREMRALRSAQGRVSVWR